MSKTKMILKPDRERALLRRHPWIFSGAVQGIKGEAMPGNVLDVYTTDGRFLAQVGYSPDSQIQGRVWSWNENEVVGEDLLRSKLQTALSVRTHLLNNESTNAIRLVHSESDGLPGLVVDHFADTLVLQISAWAAEPWRETIVRLLVELTGAKTVYERSDLDVREMEGLPERVGLLAGEELPEILKVVENDLKYRIDLKGGHKTGFYIDQRENRKLLRNFTPGKEVLDCFSYTGGFTLNALHGGAAHVTAIDSSAEALSLLEENLILNSLPLAKTDLVEADVFHQLRSYRDAARQFDVIVLDPPKFAPTRAQADKAARGYKDINLLAMKLLRPGGLLFTFSCSGGVDAALFQKIIAGAAVDAGVDAQILHTMTQSSDHPVLVHFPEGAYLKGLVCKV